MEARLDHYEELELIHVLHSSDKKKSKYALNKLVNGNLGLVRKIVNKFPLRNSSCSYDDLYQEGVIGLMKGLNKFTPEMGNRLSTYVYYWIYADVSRYYKNNSSSIRIPCWVQEQQTKNRKENEKRVRNNQEEIKSDKLYTPKVLSLNIPVGEETSTLEDLIEDTNSRQVYNELEFEFINAQIQELLDSREYNILVSRYGINGKDKLTVRECGAAMGISHSRVHQVEKAVIKKLQKYYA